jgi:hypothetical protein
MSGPPTWVAKAHRTFDSIGWTETDLMSDPEFGCISPPPFGKQCTLPRTLAIAACMAMPRCVAITCPEERESHIGERGITGPICQLRASRIANEKGHGMCKPGGCVNIGLSRMRKPPLMPNWQSLGGPGPADSPLKNPALLYLYGDTDVHTKLLPAGLGRYWPLQGGTQTDGAALPNTGILFAVDALPAKNTSSRLIEQLRFSRHELWRGSHGGRSRGRRRGEL